MKLENYKKMVELQHSFNILAMGENYLDLNLNWNSAIIAESGEMLDSLGYKWWSKCASPLSEKLRLNYYYKDGNIFNKKTNIAINSRLDNGTGYLLCVNSDLCFDIGINTIGLHRLIYMIHNGDIPDCADVDHIDQNKLNNNINNLRLLSKRDNQINSKKVTEAKGYYKIKNGKFQAQSRAENKRIYLGLFDTEKEASIAYESAKALYHQIVPIKANGFKNCVDLDNAKVEAIDLLHFVISETLQKLYKIPSKRKDFINRCITEVNYCMQDDYEFLNEYKSETIEEMISIFLKSGTGQDRLLHLKVIFKKLEMTNEDVYIAYIVKNCLNKFRQDNGYKDGTYQKIWVDKEDNVVAYELANEIGANENLFDLLYAELEDYYNSYMRR